MIPWALDAKHSFETRSFASEAQGEEIRVPRALSPLRRGAGMEHAGRDDRRMPSKITRIVPAVPAPPRCAWPKNELAIRYHDEEWGVPLHDDRRFFEFIVLDGAQAGLSWDTILRKREAYRTAFDGFDPNMVAKYDSRMIRKLLRNPGIVRNRVKVESAVRNARGFQLIQDQFGTFDAYIWRFVGGRTKVNTWRSTKEIPSRTPESDAMSKDLKSRGFTFVGSTICYAFMQAAGLVNDHVVDCFRHHELRQSTASR